MSELLRDLVSDDADTRDEVTEEVGRRLRGETGRRLHPYLQAIGSPPDPDAAARVGRLVDIRNRLDRVDSLKAKLKEFSEEAQRLERRTASGSATPSGLNPGRPPEPGSSRTSLRSSA